MKMFWKRRQATVAVLCMLLLLVATACGGGDDSDDDSETTSTAVTTPAAAASTATTAVDAEATATGTEDEDSDPTATTEEQATATEAEDEPTATTGGGDSTPTESTGSTTPETSATPGADDEFGDFETLDPELLPNFSLRMMLNATNLSGTPENTISMQMEQSAIDTYHLDMESDGELIEIWTIGDQSWMSIDGEVTESPTGPLFSPADILATGELIPDGLNANEEGTEEVNGRETTKWVIDGADYVAYMNQDAAATGIEMTDGSGEVTVWVDNELDIMLKAEGDVTWTNSDGTEGSLTYDYEIYDIGSTSDIEAPV